MRRSRDIVGVVERVSIWEGRGGLRVAVSTDVVNWHITVSYHAAVVMIVVSYCLTGE